MSEEANSARRFSPAISELTQFFFVGLGFIYTMGLLIVNLNLLTKGLLELDLARPGYLLVGGLWTLLVGSLLSFYYLAPAELEQLRSDKFWSKITWERVSRSGYFATGILLFLAFALFITGWKVDLVNAAKYLSPIVFSAALLIPEWRARATFATS